MTEQMKREEAVEFFSILFGGEHHIPNQGKLKEYGMGWAVDGVRDAATFDFDLLTRIVVLAHDKCVRVEIVARSPKDLRIAIHKRAGREGAMYARHPTLEGAVARMRGTP